MAPSPHYSNGYGSASNSNYYQPRRRHDHDSSFFDDCLAFLSSSTRALWKFWTGRGRHMAAASGLNMLRQLRRNLSWRRLFSFPHALVVIWVVVLLWGERWVYRSKVESCHWSSWENWPPGATPHRMALVADPQLIDPHSYPGRPWPLDPITITVTDNYLRRSYNQLQEQLRPDTVFFLGDLFDGGREWKTAHGDFKKKEWASKHPKNEEKYVKGWNKKYGEKYWLQEYARFGDIFLKPWVEAGDKPRSGQRGRRLISSLPGNHDLGYGADINLDVRNRFQAYFGETNRVDVIGNHTFVSVDSVSLSARTSLEAAKHNLRDIYLPTKKFLDEVQTLKSRAVDKELRFWQGNVEGIRHNHTIEEVDFTELKERATLDPRERKSADLPSILLTHVPLYRPPGTPCGPMREHWPPTKPPKGQDGPVIPDHRNAISVSGGYQYQNVLDESDSVDLITKIGNVVHAFSGDDHDYCELKHDERQGNVPEITVKSLSMAMGVPTPGFLMVSLYNPIDNDGKSLLADRKPTLQTHLCLLPKMSSVFGRYIIFGLVCILLLAIRACLVPILHLQPFALDTSDELHHPTGSVLPVFKAKAEDYDEYAYSGAAGFSASRFTQGSGHGNTRGRSGSVVTPGKKSKQYKDKDRPLHGQGKWGWGGRGPPKIEIRSEDEDYGTTAKWRVKSKKRTTLQVVGAEMWSSTWRVVWMAVGIWVWLARSG